MWFWGCLLLFGGLFYFVNIAVSSAAYPLNELVLVLGIAPADVARQRGRVQRHYPELAKPHFDVSRLLVEPCCPTLTNICAHECHSCLKVAIVRLTTVAKFVTVPTVK